MAEKEIRFFMKKGRHIDELLNMKKVCRLLTEEDDNDDGENRFKQDTEIYFRWTEAKRC